MLLYHPLNLSDLVIPVFFEKKGAIMPTVLLFPDYKYRMPDTDISPLCATDPNWTPHQRLTFMIAGHMQGAVAEAFKPYGYNFEPSHTKVFPMATCGPLLGAPNITIQVVIKSAPVVERNRDHIEKSMQDSLSTFFRMLPPQMRPDSLPTIELELITNTGKGVLLTVKPDLSVEQVAEWESHTEQPAAV